MIPRMGRRDRLRLAWAIWTGRVWLSSKLMTGWGQEFILRTVMDEQILKEES